MMRRRYKYATNRDILDKNIKFLVYKDNTKKREKNKGKQKEQKKKYTVSIVSGLIFVSFLLGEIIGYCVQLNIIERFFVALVFASISNMLLYGARYCKKELDDIVHLKFLSEYDEKQASIIRNEIELFYLLNPFSSKRDLENRLSYDKKDDEVKKGIRLPIFLSVLASLIVQIIPLENVLYGDRQQGTGMIDDMLMILGNILLYKASGEMDIVIFLKTLFVVGLLFLFMLIIIIAVSGLAWFLLSNLATMFLAGTKMMAIMERDFNESLLEDDKYQKYEKTKSLIEDLTINYSQKIELNIAKYIKKQNKEYMDLCEIDSIFLFELKNKIDDVINPMMDEDKLICEREVFYKALIYRSMHDCTQYLDVVDDKVMIKNSMINVDEDNLQDSSENDKENGAKDNSCDTSNTNKDN